MKACSHHSLRGVSSLGTSFFVAFQPSQMIPGRQEKASMSLVEHFAGDVPSLRWWYQYSLPVPCVIRPFHQYPMWCVGWLLESRGEGPRRQHFNSSLCSSWNGYTLVLDCVGAMSSFNSMTTAKDISSMLPTINSGSIHYTTNLPPRYNRPIWDSIILSLTRNERKCKPREEGVMAPSTLQS